MSSLYQVISVFKAKFISFLRRTVRKSSSLNVFLFVVTKYIQFCSDKIKNDIINLLLYIPFYIRTNKIKDLNMIQKKVYFDTVKP